MLERLLRRLLWVVPSALGVLLCAFYATSLLPAARMSERSPHRRYGDLPLFFNLAPTDGRSAAREALRAVAQGETTERIAAAEATLLELGGAALPVVLPELPSLATEERARVLTALAPLARRMELDRAEEAASPELASRFWSRFWEASEVEFRRAAAHNAARRWVVYGDAGRARELHRLDTFALQALFDLLPAAGATFDPAGASRTLDALVHATGRDDRVRDGAPATEFEACFARWRRFWIANRSRYVELSGTDRVAAIALETRLGKWALSALTTGPEDLSFAELWRRVGTTCRLLVVGWSAALGLGLALGTWTAARGGRIAQATEWAAWGAFAATAVVLASLGARARPGAIPPTLAATVVLAFGMVAPSLRLVRRSVAEFLRTDVARAARARGADDVRIAWREALPTCLPTALAAGLVELPAAITACFVVERAFAVEGLGELTLAALRSAEVGAVTLLAVAGTLLAAVGSTVSDFVLAWLDPRARRALVQVGRRG